jgi:lactate dehydrogenase-like 2-hydroxyacid dehydrogenase
MSKPKVIVTRKWPAEAEAKLEEHFDVVLNHDDHPMSADELKDALRSADAVCPTVSDKITADVLSAEPLRCKILGNFGVGFNHIDIKAAKERGIIVTNTPEVLTDCTADIAMTLLLMVARRTGEGERHVRNKQWAGWRPTHMLGTKVTGKVLGLIGFGRIAQAVAQRAHFGFGMRIMFHDPFPPPREVINRYGAIQCSTLEEVLAQADFVSLHCPGGEATHHLLNAQRIACMRPHAFLINTARGDVVDEQALVDALKAGRIAGAAMDVYEFEPKVTGELLGMENVVLFPHLGSASRETRVAMGLRAFTNVKAFFDGKIIPDRVV